MHIGDFEIPPNPPYPFMYTSLGGAINYDDIFLPRITILTPCTHVKWLVMDWYG